MASIHHCDHWLATDARVNSIDIGHLTITKERYPKSSPLLCRAMKYQMINDNNNTSNNNAHEPEEEQRTNDDRKKCTQFYRILLSLHVFVFVCVFLYFGCELSDFTLEEPFFVLILCMMNFFFCLGPLLLLCSHMFTGTTIFDIAYKPREKRVSYSVIVGWDIIVQPALFQ